MPSSSWTSSSFSSLLSAVAAAAATAAASTSGFDPEYIHFLSHLVSHGKSYILIMPPGPTVLKYKAITITDNDTDDDGEKEKEVADSDGSVEELCGEKGKRKMKWGFERLEEVKKEKEGRVLNGYSITYFQFNTLNSA